MSLDVFFQSRKEKKIRTHVGQVRRLRSHRNVLLHEVSWNQFWADFPHPQFIGQYLMNGDMTQIRLCPNHSDCQPMVCMHWIPDSVDIRVSSWNQKPSATRFTFNWLSSFWKCFKHLDPGQNTVSLGLSTFCKFFHCTVSKSKAKPDHKLLLEIHVTHCQNVLAKPASLKQPLWATIVTLAWSNLHWWHITCSPASPPRTASAVLPHLTLRYQSHYCIYTLCLSRWNFNIPATIPMQK